MSPLHGNVQFTPTSTVSRIVPKIHVDLPELIIRNSIDYPGFEEKPKNL